MSVVIIITGPRLLERGDNIGFCGEIQTLRMTDAYTTTERAAAHKT